MSKQVRVAKPSGMKGALPGRESSARQLRVWSDTKAHAVIIAVRVAFGVLRSLGMVLNADRTHPAPTITTCGVRFMSPGILGLVCEKRWCSTFNFGVCQWESMKVKNKSSERRPYLGNKSSGCAAKASPDTVTVRCLLPRSI